MGSAGAPPLWDGAVAEPVKTTDYTHITSSLVVVRQRVYGEI